jgi:hypothetical protein
MTSEALKALLEAGDAEGCIAFFAEATEDDRRALAKTAGSHLSALTKNSPDELVVTEPRPDGLPVRVFGPWNRLQPAGFRAARIAVLATATLVELKKIGAGCMLESEDAVAVLSARRPPWIADWANHILSWHRAQDRSYLGVHKWNLLRGLARAGLCPRPNDPQYIQLMVGAVTPGPQIDEPSLRDRLLSDPELLDDEVWEVFDTELPLGLRGIFSTDPDVPADERWDVALAELAAEGRVSRTRLLDACLSALERDDRDSRVRWFLSLHRKLEPTPAELAERLDRYLSLIASRNALIVTFALEAVGALDAADWLPPARLVSGIVPALLSRTKGTVLKALGFLDHAVQRDPSVKARAATVAVEALAHESPAMHKAVLDWIERHRAESLPEVVDLLRARIDTVAASERARLAGWLGATSATVSPDGNTNDGEELELFKRAAAIEPSIAEILLITELVATVRRGQGDIPAIRLVETTAPRLDPAHSITPIEDLDELIAVFLTVLESPDDPEVLERILDGVSRLCEHRPSDFDARTAPLRARAEQILAHEWPEGNARWTLRSPFAGVALAWIASRVMAALPSSEKIDHVAYFLQRMQVIAQRVAQRMAAPLLSAATHAGAWIDPRVFIGRLEIWAKLSTMPDSLDVSLALLRLAPDLGARAQALDLARKLKGPHGAAVRYALGGDAKEIGPDVCVWIAAARARAPSEDDSRVEARHPGLGPDAGRAAQLELIPGPQGVRDPIARLFQPMIARTPALPETVRIDLPTVLLHVRFAGHAVGDQRWAGTLWPLCRESYFASGAERFVGIESSPGEARSYRPLLEPLLDPDVPLRAMGRLLLVGTLSSNQPELQGLATDALIAAIDDGRLDGPLLGEALQRLFLGELLKLNRVTKALGDAARVSALHARAIAQAIEHMIMGSPPPRDLNVLLEFLKEILIEIGEPLSAPCAAWLREMKCSGKTGKLVHDVLNHTGDSRAGSAKSSALRALANRLERAERWSRAR